ncbi:unnamed protein product [Chironomus riparius]|uniref:Uncharacterized protein n=1 Tax=Chironomus riparius TaxID=315576 RepID=A0A9P0NGC4_9DIPT|nr:unnamed protein product [Chironomus riparius]
MKTRSKSLERSNSISKKGTHKKMSARKFSDLSLELDDENEPKKSKPDSDDETDDMTKILKEIRAGMTSMNKKMDILSENLSKRIDELTNDVHEIRTTLKSTKEQVTACETKQFEIINSLDTHETRLNIIDQKSLETQLMISNLPNAVNKENFINELSSWSGNIFDHSKIHKLNFNQHKESQTAFIHFQNISEKNKLMNFVKQKQTDANDKYIPILGEQILKLQEDDPERMKIIYFQTPLTPFNRQILDQAKKMKKKCKTIKKCWMMKGSIHIKLINQEKAIRLDSIEQLEMLKSSIPMETD